MAGHVYVVLRILEIHAWERGKESTSFGDAVCRGIRVETWSKASVEGGHSHRTNLSHAMRPILSHHTENYQVTRSDCFFSIGRANFKRRWAQQVWTMEVRQGGRAMIELGTLNNQLQRPKIYRLETYFHCHEPLLMALNAVLLSNPRSPLYSVATPT
ncbi:hypothetical protein M408DRAFT_28745 [Serendipita vermifera MAFF 305830]|uniref:Uncharacterized protein n=1 Tax=Serendipita vermifera MAFF 305830 TaxID=933852 RepID=A0A0C3AQT7_SERVB|nr:hypothetical protein M408DRAFT_28744 [Serendipita vermifera MAFF 305830]KIM22440.1 hypothetical protein M408DRAFT_28745 [Serendipita vermifera MAFF 305830]